MSLTYFRFPNELDNFVYFEDSKQMATVFRTQLKKAGLSPYLRHTIMKSSQDRIYIRCLNCDWVLNYLWNKYGDDSCTLNRFNLYHKHPPHELDNRVSQKQRCETIEILNNFNYGIPRIRTYLEFKWAIQPGTTHNLYYKFKDTLQSNSFPSFQQWYRKNKTKLTILSYPPAEQVICPDVLFVTCKFALNIHKQRGHITAIKILTDKISQLSPKLSSYYCIIFYGITGDDKRVLYAFSMINNEKQSNLYKAVRIFLELTGNKCESFFTDDEEKLREVIQKLKEENLFKGQHYIDPQTYLQTIEDPILRDLINNLMKAKTQAEYRKLFVEYNHTKDEKRISLLQKIDNNAHLYCLWPRQKQTFLGRFNVWQGQKFHKLLVDTLNVKRSYAHMLIKIQNNFIAQRKKYEFKCQTIIENITVENCLLDLSFVKPYRLVLYKQGFKTIMNSIYGSISLGYEKVDENMYKITDKKNCYIVKKVDEKNQTNTMDTTIVQKQDQKIEYRYECNCGYLEQMGLPCSHLVKILMRKKLDMMKYISDYWRVKKDYELWKQYYYYSQGLEMPKRGRPKRSKRNNQKKFTYN